jgi:rhodanese-related sulfurtransferase
MGPGLPRRGTASRVDGVFANEPVSPANSLKNSPRSKAFDFLSTRVVITNRHLTREQTMNVPTAAITSAQLRDLLESSTPPRVVDVRTPGEFETAHITGSYNVPLDLLDKHRPEIAQHLDQDQDVVLVCRSGQRSAKAAELLREAGLTSGSVLENGITDWEGRGFAVDRGVQGWELERQVRLVAGSVVLSSVVGSVAVPRLKWLAAAIVAGLTYGRHLEHLRDGNGAVETPVQPWCDARCQNDPVSTRRFAPRGKSELVGAEGRTVQPQQRSGLKTTRRRQLILPPALKSSSKCIHLNAR